MLYFSSILAFNVPLPIFCLLFCLFCCFTSWEENERRNNFMINLHKSMGPSRDQNSTPCYEVRHASVARNVTACATWPALDSVFSSWLSWSVICDCAISWSYLFVLLYSLISLKGTQREKSCFQGLQIPKVRPACIFWSGPVLFSLESIISKLVKFSC